MPKLLDEIERLQTADSGFDEYERLLLQMCANMLESYYEVRAPKHKLKMEEYFEVPGRFELMDGMLHWDGMRYISDSRRKKKKLGD
ncbi:MAG TPA: hypothetical protein VGL53_32105 [Bryobacteraceae bacterium]|jgi:hypothetical protein